MRLPAFERYFGVDFSGARRAGDYLWVAEVVPVRARRGAPPLRLRSLARMTDLCGVADRESALACLVAMMAASEAALWGCDFPFGLPVELFPPGSRWQDQFAFLAAWGDDAYGCGLECVRRAEALVQRKHIRRTTDAEARAPFDTFHYRLIYQTFFGMRDVIGPIRHTPRTAVLPFQYARLPWATRVLVECCPASVLKRRGAPHQNYKQPAGGPLLPKRRRARRAILDWLRQEAALDDSFCRVMMRNPGADALDAVIAAVGAAHAVPAADHAAIRRHARYRHEGRLYV